MTRAQCIEVWYTVKLNGEPKTINKDLLTEICNSICSFFIFSRFFFAVVIMCADPQSIRQIMLTAESENMIDSGEYVFINIELFSR